MRHRNNKFLGFLMVFIGIFLFLQNANLIDLDENIIPLLVGLAFIATYMLGQTWALIPGSIISCVGIAIYITSNGILYGCWPLFIFAPSVAFFIIRIVGGKGYEWAIYPACFIALGGIIAIITSSDVISVKLWQYLSYVGPIALLIVGLLLIFRSRQPKDPHTSDRYDPRM